MAAYIHKANGTIEGVIREILRVLKSLLSEFHLSQEAWPGAIPLVQSALNQASIPSLGGVVPITVFTGLPAQNPLDVVWRKDQEKFIEARKTSEEIRALTGSLRGLLWEMHKKVTSTVSSLRTQKRRKFEKHQLPNFEIGDFVLLAAPEKSFLQRSVQRGLALIELSRCLKSCISGWTLGTWGKKDGSHF